MGICKRFILRMACEATSCSAQLLLFFVEVIGKLKEACSEDYFYYYCRLDGSSGTGRLCFLGLLIFFTPLYLYQ